MKTIFLAALLLSGCNITLLARIDENESQIEARYGKPLRQWADYRGYKKLYQWHGYNVTVNFSIGVSQMERFAKTDESHFSGEEIEQLLKTNEQGFNAGRSQEGFSGVLRWQGSDGRTCVAVYSYIERILTVAREDFVAKTAAARKAGFAKQKSSKP